MVVNFCCAMMGLDETSHRRRQQLFPDDRHRWFPSPWVIRLSSRPDLFDPKVDVQKQRQHKMSSLMILVLGFVSSIEGCIRDSRQVHLSKKAHNAVARSSSSSRSYVL